MNNKNCLVLENVNNIFEWKKGVLEDRDVLKGIQNYVKGNIESISFLFPELYRKNILVYINEDGKLMNLPITLVCKTNNKHEEINGNICFIKLNSSGQLININRSDIRKIHRTIDNIRETI